ncbi:MAG: hypothetical protein LBD29_03895 [Treponema sp.]|nr:hypothetical protein [Treponema sp.]
MIINAQITGIKYTPFLCEPLNICSDFETALNEDAVCLLNICGNLIAVSKWVSPKRTRSYPYARVCNTLNHYGKKATIIPFVKDEGADGDRDFIQWDTISLMSLLGVYVIIAYYSSASKNTHYANKITAQKFDTQFIHNEIEKLLSYQSDALHWNIDQINNIAIPANLSKYHYAKIQIDNKVKMHSPFGIDKRIAVIQRDKNEFMNLSRHSAQAAQIREINTIQPKENITDGIKAQINITNYLGGMYYLTCDEAKIDGNAIHIIEAKHTKNGILPSIDDIKDGLVKMILFSNLKNVLVNGIPFQPIPTLKLTSGTTQYRESELSRTIMNEAKTNKFTLIMPNGDIVCPNTP